MKAIAVITFLVVLLSAPCSFAYDDDKKEYRPPWNGSFASGESKSTENGFFKVSWTAEEMPVPLFAPHNWILLVSSFDGLPAGEARIAVSGFMPMQDLYMDTIPSIENLGGGVYLVRGMRFSIAGQWEIYIEIYARGLNDRVSFKVDIG